MKRKAGMATLAVLCGLLAALPGLTGCGESETSHKIVFGYMWDLTGRSSSAVKLTY